MCVASVLLSCVADKRFAAGCTARAVAGGNLHADERWLRLQQSGALIVSRLQFTSLLFLLSLQNIDAYSGSNDVIISICLIFVCIAFFVVFLWTALGTLFQLVTVRSQLTLGSLMIC